MRKTRRQKITADLHRQLYSLRGQKVPSFEKKSTANISALLGEPVEGALEREIKEEYCAEIIQSDFLGFRDVHRIDEKGNKTHWVVLDFKVLIDKDKVKNGVPNEHEEIGWFKLDNLPSPVHSQFPTFVKKYKYKLK